MKVLKRVPWSHTFTCKGCQSDLRAEREDVMAGEFGGSYCECGDSAVYGLPGDESPCGRCHPSMRSEKGAG